MIKKKIQTISIACFMLLAVLAIIPIAQASSPHSVKGILYINDEIPTSSAYDFEEIIVKLIFPGDTTYENKTYEYNLYSDNTNYIIGFWGHEGETADIHVEYYGEIITPDDNQTITISSTIGYIMDIRITVEEPEPDTEPPSPPADDDDDDTTTGDDDDTGDGIIPNNPPEIVEFIGDEEGSKNTALNYSATATDPDGHDVKYIFDWDDGNENETEFVANGTKYNITHIFTTAGVYEISVYAIDDYAEGGSPSATESLQILIDAHIIDDTENNVDGYLTDDDGDGIYNNFYNYDDDSITEVSYDSTNGTYLLDTTGDGEYNYRYDPNTGTGELIEEDTKDDDPAGDPKPVDEDNTLLYIGAILIIIILLLLFFLATRKKDKGKKGKK